MSLELETEDPRTLEFKARVFKVLGDSNRIKIMEFLRGGERCQCEIIPILEQSQPTVSRHLRLLEEAGLIISRKDGNRTFYRVADERAFNILDSLDYELMLILSHGLRSKLIAA
jgi:ArsR family transcriptional regulator